MAIYERIAELLLKPHKQETPPLIDFYDSLPPYVFRAILEVEKNSRALEENLRPYIEEIKRRRDFFRKSLESTDSSETFIEQHRKKEETPEEELERIKEAIAFTVALFENWQTEKRGKKFELRDNQLAFIILNVLSGGRYNFGEITTGNRMVELPTGEGKTYAVGISAAILSLFQNEKVWVVEPNYNSAIDHASQLAEFFEMMGINIAVLADLPNPYQQVIKIQTNADGKQEYTVAEPAPNQQYIYLDGNFFLLPAAEQRRNVYEAGVVYTDPNSIIFDWVKDRVLGQKNPSGQPDLSEVTALVCEAELTLIDQAITPYIISQEYLPEEFWEDMAKDLEIDKVFQNPEIVPLSQKAFLAQTLFFSVFDAVYSYWPTISPEINYNLIVGFTLSSALLDFVFQLVEARIDTLPCYSKATKKKIKDLILDHQEIIIACLQAVFYLQYGKEYIGQKEASVVLDTYGFPYLKHKYEDLIDVFLRMKINWERWKSEVLKSHGVSAASKKTSKKRGELTAGNILMKMIKRYAKDLAGAKTVDEVLPVVFFQGFKRIIGNSGSILPSCELIRSVYQTETYKISRHSKPEIYPPDENYPLHLRCLDEGIAGIRMARSNEELLRFLIEKAVSSYSQERSLLLVFPDMVSAQKFSKILEEEAQIKPTVITAQEELEQPGVLSQKTREIPPRSVIVTSQVALRDIDPRPSLQLQEKGGIEVVIVNLPPTVRDLFQGLQRVGRGDDPGRRGWVLSLEELESTATPSKAEFFRKLRNRERLSPRQQLEAVNYVIEALYERERHYFETIRRKEKIQIMLLALKRIIGPKILEKFGEEKAQNKWQEISSFYQLNPALLLKVLKALKKAEEKKTKRKSIDYDEMI